MTIHIMRKALIKGNLVLAALGPLILVACSTGGTPQPSTTGTANPTASDSNSLTSLDPCSLITDQETSSLHLSNKHPEYSPVTADGRSCAWRASADVVGVANSYGLNITVEPHLGLKDLNTAGEQIQQVTFKNHHGEQAFNGSGCVISIVITDSSLVDVTTDGAKSENMCQLANQYAQLIEPKLPQA